MADGITTRTDLEDKMEKIKIERLLLPVIGLLTLAVLTWPFVSHHTSWDFHVHDTWIVVTGFAIAIAALLYNCLLFGLYRFFRKRNGRFNPIIGLVHIVTVFAFMMYGMFGHFFFTGANYASGLPARYLDYSELNFSTHIEYMQAYHKIFSILLILFLFTQLICWVYFVRLFSRLHE